MSLKHPSNVLWPLTPVFRLMVQMLYTAHTGVLILGMFMCALFGNDTRLLQPSVDLLLFLGTAVVSKHIESLPEPHEHRFDAHILCLAGLYLVAGDKFRVSLLGAWLPYFYMANDRVKCVAYLSLAATVPMFPHLCRACYAVWPLLCNSIKMGFSKLCIYAIKAIESITPYPVILSHPSPPQPTLSLSPIITTANITPLEKPKVAMVDSSTQKESLAKKDRSTQCEEDWFVKPVCSTKISTRYIVTGNGIFRTPPDVEQPPTKRYKSVCVRKQRLRGPTYHGLASKVPTPVPSPPASPSASPPALPVKHVKSVRFAPASSPAAPAPLPASMGRSSLAVFYPDPVSPSPEPCSQLISTIPNPVPAVVSPEPTPEPTPAPVVEPVRALVPEPSVLTVECAPVLSSVSCFAAQLTPSSSVVSRPPSPIPSSSPIPNIPSPTLVPGHLSPKIPALPSPISSAVSLQSPMLASLLAPVSAPTPDVLSPLLPSPVIWPTMASLPVSVLELDPKSNVQREPLCYSPVLAAVSDLATTSHPDASIVAPIDQMETDFESVDTASVMLPVDDRDDIQMGGSNRQEPEATFDFSLRTDDTGIDTDFDPTVGFILTSEDIDLLFNEALFASGHASLGSNALTTDNEVENFLNAETDDVPVIEDFPSVQDFFAPAIGERVQYINSDVISAVNHFNDDMTVDAVLGPVPESPEFVMNGGKSKEESVLYDSRLAHLASLPMSWTSSTAVSSTVVDGDDQMDDVDETDETAETGDIVGSMSPIPILRQQFAPASPTMPSTPINTDSRENEDSGVFDMSGLLSSLPPTPETSPTAPLQPNSAADDRMSASASVYGSVHALFASPPSMPSPISNASVPTSDHHFRSGATGFPSSTGLVGTSAPAMVSIAAAGSLGVSSTLILAGLASEGEATSSSAISAMPTTPASPVRPILAAVSISKRLPPPPPRPSPAQPPIVFNMAPNPVVPKLDSRFVLSSVPRRLTCNILALQPGYRPTRKLSVAPRTKEVYVEEIEGNGGYRQKVRWHTRGSPPLDEEALAQLEKRMDEVAEEVKKDWPSRRAGIEEQTALDLAAKKRRDQETVAAQRAAASQRLQRRRKEKPVSVFMTVRRKGRP
ncbi:hypothetical protein F5Y12DRAFT_793831 [Xylaria sp. FL1777]|nr:hypothetical protein F5Y12DRAFT_793831 [Xylaria sp. FL1777]